MLDLASKRQQIGLTQTQLAQESGVSLPTIQNLEAGRGNPTLEVLERLTSALGGAVEWKPLPIDWVEGARLGVPLLSSDGGEGSRPQPEQLLRFLRSVYQNWSTRSFEEREIQALGALLLALKVHYPTFYRGRVKSGVAEGILSRVEDDSKVIKLRRIALARLSEYL